MIRNYLLLGTSLLAAALLIGSTGTSTVQASSGEAILAPDALVCDLGWRSYKTSSAYSMPFSKMADGTHYLT